MKPTVGRIVYYKSYGTPNGEYKPEDRAAVVTAVHTETCIDLCVFNPTGLFFNQKVTQGSNGGQWDWMPYQKGQATKTDDLVKNMRDVIKVQGADGNWNYDPYMYGMYNGMELMLAMTEEREPVFRDAPVEWLTDRSRDEEPAKVSESL